MKYVIIVIKNVNTVGSEMAAYFRTSGPAGGSRTQTSSQIKNAGGQSDESPMRIWVRQDLAQITCL